MRFEKMIRGGTEYAILPLAQLKKLVIDAEMLADVVAYDTAKRRLAIGEDELVPLALTERRLNGENPLKIWREFRQLTQAALANRSKVSRPMIAAIEAGNKTGGIATLKKLAVALNVDLEHLA